MQRIFCLWRSRRTISDLLRTTIPRIVCCEFRAGDSWDERRQEQSLSNTHLINTYRTRSEKCVQENVLSFLLCPCVKLTRGTNTFIKSFRSVLYSQDGLNMHPFLGNISRILWGRVVFPRNCFEVLVTYFTRYLFQGEGYNCQFVGCDVRQK